MSDPRRILAPAARLAARRPRLLLFSASLAVCLLAWRVIPPDLTVIGAGDSAEYLQLAHEIWQGQGYSSDYRAPLYPLAISPLVGLFGANLLVLRLFNALCQGLALAVLFTLTDRMFGRRAAWSFGLIFLAYPHLAYQSANILTESLFMLLAALMVYLLYRAADRPALTLPAGICAGLALLARPNLLIALPLLALYPLLLGHRRVGLLVSAGFLLGAALTIAPWTLHNYYRSGGGTILVTTGGGYNFWLGNSRFTMVNFFMDRDRNLGGYLDAETATDPALTSSRETIHPASLLHVHLNAAQQEQIFYHASFESMRRHPGLFLKLYRSKLLNLLRPWSDSRSRYDHNLLKMLVTALAYTPVLLLGLGGLWMLAKRRRWRESLPALLILSAAGFMLLFWPSQRFRVPLMDPYLMIYAGFLLSLVTGRREAGAGAPPRAEGRAGSGKEAASVPVAGA